MNREQVLEWMRENYKKYLVVSEVDLAEAARQYFELDNVQPTRVALIGYAGVIYAEVGTVSLEGEAVSLTPFEEADL